MNSENSIPLFDFSDQDNSRQTHSAEIPIIALNSLNVQPPIKPTILTYPPPPINFLQQPTVAPPIQIPALPIFSPLETFDSIPIVQAQLPMQQPTKAIPQLQIVAAYAYSQRKYQKQASVQLNCQSAYDQSSSFSVYYIFENISKKKPYVLVEQDGAGVKKEESSVMNPDMKKQQCNEAPIFDKISLPATLKIPEIKDKTPTSSLSNPGKQSRRMKSSQIGAFSNSFFKNASDNIGGYGGGFGGLDDSLFGLGY